MVAVLVMSWGLPGRNDMTYHSDRVYDNHRFVGIVISP